MTGFALLEAGGIELKLFNEKIMPFDAICFSLTSGRIDAQHLTVFPRRFDAK